jgi:hypothetical protein
VAFALEARAAAETRALLGSRSRLQRLRSLVRAIGEAARGGGGGGIGGADGGGGGDSSDDVLMAAAAVTQVTMDETATPHAGALTDDADASSDCPLTCSATALSTSMPRALAAAASADASIDGLRVWTTLCCIAALERLPVCVLAGDARLFPERERTVVDAAREWVEREAAAKSALASALASGSLARLAEAATAAWHAATEARIGALRRAHAIRATMPAAQRQRAAMQLTRALVNRHPMISVFASEPLDGLRRAQLWVILVSVVASQLLVSIWLFFAQGVNCCVLLRALLDAGPDGGACPPGDISAPCRGFTGECAALAQQFAAVPILPHYPAGLAEYTCVAFPNSDAPRMRSQQRSCTTGGWRSCTASTRATWRTTSWTELIWRSRCA